MFIRDYDVYETSFQSLDLWADVGFFAIVVEVVGKI